MTCVHCALPILHDYGGECARCDGPLCWLCRLGLRDFVHRRPSLPPEPPPPLPWCAVCDRRVDRVVRQDLGLSGEVRFIVHCHGEQVSTTVSLAENALGEGPFHLGIVFR